MVKHTILHIPSLNQNQSEAMNSNLRNESGCCNELFDVFACNGASMFDTFNSNPFISSRSYELTIYRRAS